MKLTETSTVEFFSKRGSLFCIYNGKTMKLENFVKLGKFDTEVAKALGAIKNKMNDMHFKGSMIDFLYLYFSENNKTPDVMVHNGVPSLYDDIYVKDSYIQFDDVEIEKAMKALGEDIDSISEFVTNLRSIK